MPKKKGGLSKTEAVVAGLFFLAGTARTAAAAMVGRQGNASAALENTTRGDDSGLQEGPYDYLLDNEEEGEVAAVKAEERRKKTPFPTTAKPTARGRPTPPTRRKKATHSPSRPTKAVTTKRPTPRPVVTKRPSAAATKAPAVAPIRVPDEPGFSNNYADYRGYSIPRRGPTVSMNVELKGSQGNSYFAVMGQVRNIRLGAPVPLAENLELGLIARNAKVFVVRYYNTRGDWVQYNYIAPPKKLPSVDFPGSYESVGVYMTCSFLSGMASGATNALFLHNALQPGKNPKQGFQDRRPGVIIAKISDNGIERPYPWGVGNPRTYSDIGFSGGATYDFNVGSEKRMQWDSEYTGGNGEFNGQGAEFARKYRELFANQKLSVAFGADDRAQISFVPGRDGPRPGRRLRGGST